MLGFLTKEILIDRYKLDLSFKNHVDKFVINIYKSFISLFSLSKIIKQTEELSEKRYQIEKGHLRVKNLICLILFIGLILVSGLYIDLYQRYKAQHDNFLKQEEDLRILKDKFDDLTPILGLINMSLERPPTHSDRGVVLVSGYSIEYWVRRVDSDFTRSGFTFFAIFYAPYDSLTLRMYLFFWHRDGLEIPLTIQRGNALRNESGIFVEMRGNITTWQSPVIWSINASRVGIYEATLPSRGWYTLSISGPIQIQSRDDPPPSTSLHISYIPYFYDLQINVDFKLLRNGEPIIFAIARRW